MPTSLTKFAWMSIAAAIFTMGLKFVAFLVTGSVGLLSDAMEGLVNLFAATVALVTLYYVERPPDESHQYGHDKAEYFSSGTEGTLILVAAAAIFITAVLRLFDPQPIEQPGLGLVLAVVASIANLIVAQILIRTGKRNDSIVLEADGRHLMTDVWSSVAIVAGVGVSVLTDLEWLDPVIAIVVGINIARHGISIFLRSVRGLMDTPIKSEERQAIEEILNRYASSEVRWHALRTRQSGARRFVNVHLLVPGAWTVKQGHDLSESLEADIRAAVRRAIVLTHLEPADDPIAQKDKELERVDNDLS